MATQPARVGYLVHGTLATSAPSIAAFRQGLTELGYVEGQDIVIMPRVSEGREDVLPQLASELVQQRVDVILTSGTPAIRATMQATATIPILFATSGDPVADGFVASLARPGGNATGMTSIAGAESEKQLELLKETVPSISRVGMLFTRSTSNIAVELSRLEHAGSTLSVRMLQFELDSAADLEAALNDAVSASVEGLLLIPANLLLPLETRIAQFAADRRLPSISWQASFAHAGGLLAYGPSIPENFRRAAIYVDKILKGARPGDLPVERPTRFEFAVNVSAARAMSIAIPDSVLAQATDVIK
jgi:ABC-type uncharacterized transport system substrate-binding protein